MRHRTKNPMARMVLKGTRPYPKERDEPREGRYIHHHPPFPVFLQETIDSMPARLAEGVVTRYYDGTTHDGDRYYEAVQE